MKPDLYGNHMGIIFILNQSDVFPVGVRGTQLCSLCYMGVEGWGWRIIWVQEFLRPAWATHWDSNWSKKRVGASDLDQSQLAEWVS